MDTVGEAQRGPNSSNCPSPSLSRSYINNLINLNIRVRMAAMDKAVYLTSFFEFRLFDSSTLTLLLI